jgi:hypothetical protein
MTNRGALELEPRKPGICRKNAVADWAAWISHVGRWWGPATLMPEVSARARHLQVVETAASVFFPAQGWSAEGVHAAHLSSRPHIFA